MLETKCVGDNFEMLVTVSAVFVISLLYLLTLASGTNIQKMSPISKFFHEKKNCHQHKVTNIYVAKSVRRTRYKTNAALFMTVILIMKTFLSLNKTKIRQKKLSNPDLLRNGIFVETFVKS